MDDLPVGGRFVIPGAELRVSFARSGGPGGQNVNKVESKVELRWNLPASSAPGEADREWLARRLASRLTSGGDLVVVSSRTRDQSRNREDARAKLARLLAAALRRPKARRRTRPSARSIERRLRAKRERGEAKEGRRAPDAAQ